MGLMVAIGVAEVITVTTVLESVAVVGAVVGAVGAVTHNKTLSMIGLGLGIVGGVGALATSALGAGTAAITGAESAGDTGAAAAGAASDAAGGAAGVAPDVATSMSAAEAAADPASAVASGVSAGSGAAPDVVGALSGETTAPAVGDAVADAAGIPAGDVAGTGTAAANAADPASSLASGLGTGPQGSDVNLLATTSEDAGTDTSVAANAGVNATPPLGGVNPDGSPMLPGATAPNNPADLIGADGKAITPPQPPGEESSFLSKLIDYAGNHQVLALGALQAGGSLLSGLTSTVTPAQAAAYNAQAAANNAAATLTQQQATNLAMPKSVASSTPVTGAPAPLVPGQAGLINQAPRLNVTGVPALT